MARPTRLSPLCHCYLVVLLAKVSLDLGHQIRTTRQLYREASRSYLYRSNSASTKVLRSQGSFLRNMVQSFSRILELRTRFFWFPQVILRKQLNFSG